MVRFFYWAILFLISINLQSQDIKKQKELENRSRILKKEIKKINDFFFQMKEKRKMQLMRLRI